ncbi:MAG: biotin/lipoyl-binding protein [Ruminococcaceae bacterium]|nr:biotin/lipoyl-binding protein [Oscillospiraceae bacterium]
MKYKINLHGRAYEVEVEFAKPMTRGEFDSYAPAPAAPVAAAPVAAAPAAPALSAAVAVQGEVVAAPMPGNILKVNVRPGQTVEEGTVLVILEAMKMENEILAPRAGSIAQVLVNEGATVDTGTALVTLA